jgi:putative ABC transport system permease protein
VKIRRRLRLSTRGLLAHRRRVALVTGSVALGVASVLVTSALGQGARDAVLRDVARLGTNLLVIRPTQVERHVARPAIRGRVSTLRPEDCRELAALPEVREVAPSRDGGARVKVGRRSMNALVFGTSPDFFSLRALRLRSGRFLRPFENDAALRVAVLGARVADTLFPDVDPTGATIRVGGVPFVVVGVLEPRGVLADGSDEDGNLFVPIRTALRRVFNTTWITGIFVSARTPERMPAAEEAIRRVLRERHRLPPDAPDDFEVQNQARLLETREAVATSLTLLVAGLAGGALLIGGTGVLALMLLSVKERTGEIGLRMALGARPRDVFVQFLGESSLLSLGGWVGGALIGTPVVLGLAFLTEWPVGLPLVGVAATLVTTVLTGVGFGAWPARRAARLLPIRALTRG